MKETLTQSSFIQRFKAIRPHAFSYTGLCVLYEYLTDLETETETEMEFDPIAICCDYSEYDSKREAISDLYGKNPPDDADVEIIKTFNNESIIIFQAW